MAWDPTVPEFTVENTSMHANGVNDQGCRICHEIGHFARDCPEKTDGGGGGGGGCFNCGEIGHNKADCPNPAVEREFTGECRICSQTGHRTKDCPQAPPQLCKRCKQEGHEASACSAHRMHAYFEGLRISEMSDREAYDALLVAGQAEDFDLDDAKTAIFAYAKAVPTATWADVEECCRENNLKIYLIAKVQETADTHTIIDLQGQGDRDFVVTFQTSNKPRRAKFAEGWPTGPEENMTRLSNAGLPMDRLLPKCSNCSELGHVRRNCPQEAVAKEVVEIKCANCDVVGHRARDCTEPRKSSNRACKNCGQEGHISKECPEPPNLDNVECKNCGQMGHFSRDCPSREPDVCRNCFEEGHRAKDCDKERVMKCRNCDGLGHAARECDKPKDMSRIQCRNCDEMGHTGRECPKPTDWSRVECTNCHEKGHTYRRCTKPAAEEEDAGWGQTETPAAGSGGGDGWNSGGPAEQNSGW